MKFLRGHQWLRSYTVWSTLCRLQLTIDFHAESLCILYHFVELNWTYRMGLIYIYILFICLFCIHLSLLHYKKMLKIKYSEASLNVDTTKRLRSFGASNSVESLNKCFDRLKERKLNHFVEFIAQLAHLEATYPHSDELL